MQGGFSFCGTDIADLGLEYVPDNANTYVFAGSDYKVHEQAFDAHDGGYFYGTTTGIKVFTQRCIFQETRINDGIQTKIENFFRKGRSGRLVFRKRPWVYYVATVTALDIKSITNYMNGFVTIQMKAYYPYGRCDRLYYTDEDENRVNIIANSNMLHESMFTSTKQIDDGKTQSVQKEFLLHNGGTEKAAVAIEIAGDVGSGVVVENITTGQKCSFVALTKKQTTDQGKYQICDGLNGRTILTDGVHVEDAHLYHDYGFIDLAPGDVLERDTEFYAFPSSNYIAKSSNYSPLSEDIIGKYIYADGQWRAITGWLPGLEHYQFNVSPSLAGDNFSGTMPIAAMNRIVVTPISDMSLTRLNFVYKPTFA